MDEDSQDELINKNAAVGKVKRTNALLFSDAESSDGNSGDSDDTGSGDEGDTNEDGDEENEESEDEDLEDTEEEEAEDDVEITSEQPEYSIKTKPQLNGEINSSTDEDAENCPICLNTFRHQAVGTPENCAHYFCLDCIVEWSKNANSCPVDRILFKSICVRVHFDGEILKKIPVENAKSQEDGLEEDPTFCEVCGRSDREDRLLLCDGCDAGYHMECLNPPLSEVPVDEWFCPPCAPANARPAEADQVSEEEVASLIADVIPTTSRLRPSARTRAIARTRQSERVRATVNRNRITTAQRIQHVPRYFMSSFLDETIEAVAAGLSTAVYQRPLTPRTTTRKKRKGGRRRRTTSKKLRTKSSAGKKGTGTWIKRRKHRTKRRKGRKIQVKAEVTARSRIAKTLHLGKPIRGTSIPSICKPIEPSLGYMRADIGAASLSVFGDPFELDPYNSNEELPVANSASPMSTKRRCLSQSALRSHRPVARPVAVGLPGRGVPALIPEPEAEPAPVPDLLGSILTGQSLLMMSGSDVVINRDGSLTAKKTVPLLRGSSRADEALEDNFQSMTPILETLITNSGTDSSNSKTAVSKPCASSPLSLSVTNRTVTFPHATVGRAPIRFDYSMTPRSVQTHNLTNLNRIGSKVGDSFKFNGGSKLPLGPLSATPKLNNNSNSISKTIYGKQPLKSPPKRPDISELPRIPKIKREEANSGPQPATDQNNIPSSCITQLTGKGNTSQPIRSNRMETSKPQATQQQTHSSGATSASAAAHGSSSFSSARGKVGGSSFESFKINIPGNMAHSHRLSNPGFCNTFRPVDNKVQQKENPSPLFSLKKMKPIKSEIYDPFDPTGSDSSSTHSSPERLPLTNITRTISIGSSKVQTFQTVRRITPYPLENIFESEVDSLEAPSSNAESHDDMVIKERFVEQVSDSEQDKFDDKEDSDIPCNSSAIKQVTEAEHDDDKYSPGVDFEDDWDTIRVEREVVSPSIEEQQRSFKSEQATKRSFSSSPSNSSSQSQREVKIKKIDMKEGRPTKSRSRSRTPSRDRSSRSASHSIEKKYTKSHGVKSKTRRSSSDCSSSYERSKKKKAKSKTKDKKPSVGPKEHKRSRSQSDSPGNYSFEMYETKKKKKHSRARDPECSQSNSAERAKKKKHKRERSYDRYEKERTSSSRDMKGYRSWEKHKRRSRSPELKPYESKESKSKEKPLQFPSCSKEKKHKPKKMSPQPLQEKASRSLDEQVRNSEHSLSWEQELDNTEQEATNIYCDLTPVQEISSKDNIIKVAFDDSTIVDDDKLDNEVLPSQLDSTDFEALPDNLDSPIENELTIDYDSSIFDNQSSDRQEENEIKEEDDVCPFLTDSFPEKEAYTPSCDEASLSQTLPESKMPVLSKDVEPVLVESTVDINKAELEAIAQSPVLKSKALVKRVTWNLQEEESDIVAVDKTERMPFCKQQKPKEGVWKAEDLTQSLNQPYSQNLALTVPLPSVLPPYAPVSQPTVQFIRQGNLPLFTCTAEQELIPESGGNLTPVSEPSIQEASTGDAEEKVKTSKSPVDKTKNEEYMKKLHVQERAVEEVKLAIKPFYQKREITKEEYKDILRKAVQKICHSKSGEINPMKVANLVKAYVEKYKHIRKHKKTDAEEEPHDSTKK
ncbi:LOW QUALITY PROTEIN: PHD and RING finger domain-containing protein 1 [Erythrolamprus reginae]|uniref:LOW QUALITY PROTEIN: PHD and RING finger domain-containing protein 1 n=1 Tax=Erythrolamprus reginae TaxID=121349 RepID=UPI00396C995F